MIITVTLNPAIDKTAVIPGFTAGAVNRIESLRTDVGGKGINVSKCLAQLGCENAAVAFWGGAAGKRGEEALHAAGIQSWPIWITGETRTNLKVIDPLQKQNTDINEPGPEITEEEQKQLMMQLDRKLQAGDILVLAGSIPKGMDAGIYQRMIQRYQARGVKVFLDADGESFRLGASAAPYLIKPNIDELSRFVNQKLTKEEEILAAVQPLLEQGIYEIVVSMGSLGAMFIRKDHCYTAESISVPVKSTVGAGDSMVAALAYGCEKGLSDRERYSLAMAISAASVMCSGTQAPDREVVEKLFHQAYHKYKE